MAGRFIPEKFSSTLRDRFDRKVDRSGECWVWTGAGRVVSVLWICKHPGCKLRKEVNPKKMREEELAKYGLPIRKDGL